jgi:hypothetical protein
MYSAFGSIKITSFQSKARCQNEAREEIHGSRTPAIY